MVAWHSRLMDRLAFISGLQLQAIRPIDLVAFYRRLPPRIPSGSSDGHAAARGSVGDRLAVLNAHTLGRDADLRVPIDVEEITAQLADRLARFSSADWAGGNPTMLDAARQTLGEILADIREATDDAGTGDDDPEDGSTDWDD
jgi:hypothetical protein